MVFVSIIACTFVMFMVFCMQIYQYNVVLGSLSCMCKLILCYDHFNLVISKIHNYVCNLVR